MLVDEMPAPPPLGPGGARGESPPSLLPPEVVRGSSSFTYTSGVDLREELKVQGDMLMRVSAQQRYILDELVTMRASRGLPPQAAGTCAPSTSPTNVLHAAMCA